MKSTFANHPVKIVKPCVHELVGYNSMLCVCLTLLLHLASTRLANVFKSHGAGEWQYTVSNTKAQHLSFVLKLSEIINIIYRIC